jgi:hypothetical protein
MAVGTVGGEMFKAGTTIIKNPEDVQAGITYHNAVRLRIGWDSPETAWR